MTPAKDKPQRFISNIQRLEGKDSRVIFEYVDDVVIRVYVCIVKKNDLPPIKRSDLRVSLMDSNGNNLHPLSSSPGMEENLVESSSASTTAQAMFEFTRTAGQNLLFASVQLGEESKIFQLEDAQVLR
jgi:hypothetical protein